jgi:putative phosphoesterase
MEVEKVRLLYTHGHLFGVKGGLDKLQKLAKENDAKIVLFGHTHRPFFDYIDEAYYLNPGNAYHNGKYQFSIVDITKNGIFCTNAFIES